MKTNRTILFFALFLLSESIYAERKIHVHDDLMKPVKSEINVNGQYISTTDSSGLASIANEKCVEGAKVIAIAVDQGSYLARSSEGRCKNDESPLSLRINRRMLANNLASWAAFAEKKESFGLAAHANNELFGIYIGTDPDKAEQYRKATLVNSAKFIDENPTDFVIYDADQDRSVMSKKFSNALSNWNENNGLKSEGKKSALDNQFFEKASKIKTHSLLYASPPENK